MIMRSGEKPRMPPPEHRRPIPSRDSPPPRHRNPPCDSAAALSEEARRRDQSGCARAHRPAPPARHASPCDARKRGAASSIRWRRHVRSRPTCCVRISSGISPAAPPAHASPARPALVPPRPPPPPPPLSSRRQPLGYRPAGRRPPAAGRRPWRAHRMS